MNTFWRHNPVKAFDWIRPGYDSMVRCNFGRRRVNNHAVFDHVKLRPSAGKDFAIKVQFRKKHLINNEKSSLNPISNLNSVLRNVIAPTTEPAYGSLSF